MSDTAHDLMLRAWETKARAEQRIRLDFHRRYGAFDEERNACVQSPA